MVIMAHRGHAADHRLRRGGLAAGGGTWAGDAGGMVGRHPDGRPAARLVHHGACRHDDLRPAARTPVLRPRTEPPPAVCDARPAVRERVDRRHLDAFRSAAGPDGGASVGLGHAVHADALRVASGGRDRCATGVYFLAFRSELIALARTARRRRRGNARRRRSGRRAGAAAGASVGRSHAHGVSGVDGRECALSGAVHRRIPVLPRLRPRHRCLPEPGVAARAAAGRLLSRRTGHPRRPAGVVDCADACEPLGRFRCSSAPRC